VAAPAAKTAAAPTTDAPRAAARAATALDCCALVHLVFRMGVSLKIRLGTGSEREGAADFGRQASAQRERLSKVRRFGGTDNSKIESPSHPADGSTGASVRGGRSLRRVRRAQREQTLAPGQS